jgi:hypothetical protein
MHLTGAMFDKKQDLQRLQSQRLNGKKVTGQKPMLIVIQEYPPGASLATTFRRGWYPMPLH